MASALPFLKKYFAVFIGALLALSTSAQAGYFLSFELGPACVARNDVGIPVNTGTRFSLQPVAGGPFVAWRLYGGYTFNDRHSLRALYAPFAVQAQGTYAQNIDFAGQTYAGGTPLTATYQFNSYRLTYRYAFYLSDKWKMYVGFTGKIRDARIALSQGTTSSESKNVGFVPLLHFAAEYQLNDSIHFVFDMDGLAAPQGRAFDISLQAVWQVSPKLDLYTGYRTVEGGAQSDTVYTFAWVNYMIFGTTLRF